MQNNNCRVFFFFLDHGGNIRAANINPYKVIFLSYNGTDQGAIFYKYDKTKKKKHTIDVEKHEMISLLENTSYEQKSVFGLFFPSKMDS